MGPPELTTKIELVWKLRFTSPLSSATEETIAGRQLWNTLTEDMDADAHLTTVNPNCHRGGGGLRSNSLITVNRLYLR